MGLEGPIADISALLTSRSEPIQAVTICGPAGIGKSILLLLGHIGTWRVYCRDATVTEVAGAQEKQPWPWPLRDTWLGRRCGRTLTSQTCACVCQHPRQDSSSFQVFYLPCLLAEWRVMHPWRMHLSSLSKFTSSRRGHEGVCAYGCILQDLVFLQSLRMPPCS